MRGLIDPPCQTIISSSFTGRSVRWDARSDRVPPLPSSQARLLAPSPLRTVRNTFALHGSSTQQRPLNERGRSLIQVQLRPTRYWLTADSHGDGEIHQACGKPHQRLAPSSFALLPASVPDRCSQMHRCLAVPVPTLRLRDSLSECYITVRCLPALPCRLREMRRAV